ncbi:homing endonuclease associated repeat-containing protein [Listeria booriae]|uniref:homing endonuclease associated repeat-containing protein n=1 Tax=Listeria booriae TaxID=1552123 RepID=UPI001C8BCD1F
MLGRAPKRREYVRSGMAIKRYGSWTDALRRAGIEPLDVRKSISKDELGAILIQKTEELGYIPRVSSDEFKQAKINLDHGTLL